MAILKSNLREDFGTIDACICNHLSVGRRDAIAIGVGHSLPRAKAVPIAFRLDLRLKHACWDVVDVLKL
jgi:hypothetical protein